MAKIVDWDNWLPMGEVVAQTGLSERTIYRMVTEGKIKQAQRPIAGRRPLAVFDPADVAEVVTSMLKVNPIVSTGDAHNGSKGAAMANLTALIKQAVHPEDKDPNAPLLPSELHYKLYLTEAEAVEYTGLGRGYLREKAQGKTIGPRGSMVYRRTVLEKL